ncbi:hypothetical protein [Streptomyces antimicrobicus]|uniref:Lipoprotein n=1 Tax=Streptomyces antimicrobicus TaxID=2883108 RepID=A0ABS8B7U6_9ACTN|nr:hypothetical protein [Streptomyces antimicrobicus]MCB5180694.1 hypothetical protein [Streptomyces antimicrobicus]
MGRARGTGTVAALAALALMSAACQAAGGGPGGSGGSGGAEGTGGAGGSGRAGGVDRPGSSASDVAPRAAADPGRVRVGRVSPDTSADGTAHVACSEIDAQFTVEPSAAATRWRATALDHDPVADGSGAERGIAPDVVVTPDTGALAPGERVTVRVRGRFDGERPVFWVVVQALEQDGDVRQRIAFSCR